MDDQERARRAVEAAEARHRARMAAIDIARKAMEAALEGRRAAHQARMTAARAHMEALHLAERLRVEAYRRGLSGRPRSRKRRPPEDDAGEPIPAVPKPRPNPLSGTAAAEIGE